MCRRAYPSRKLCLQLLERRSQHLTASDDHIVTAGLHVTTGMCPDGFLQPPADAVSCHRVAHLFGDGYAETRCAGVFPVQDFEQEQPATALLAAADRQKLRASSEAVRCDRSGICLSQFRSHLANFRSEHRAGCGSLTMFPPVPKSAQHPGGGANTRTSQPSTSPASGQGLGRAPRLRRTTACDRACGAPRRPNVRPWSPCARGSRDAACGRVWKADRYASFVSIPRRAALLGSVSVEQERFGRDGAQDYGAGHGDPSVCRLIGRAAAGVNRDAGRARYASARHERVMPGSGRVKTG